MKVLAMVVVLACGCSAIATRSSPRMPENTCIGYVPAVIDTGLTAVLLGLAVRSYRDNHCTSNDGCHNFDPTGLYVLPVLVLGISAAYGFGAENACRARASAPPRPVVHVAHEP